MYPQSDISLAMIDIDASKGFVDLWVHLSFGIFAIFYLKGQLKLPEMAFNQVQTWAHFPIKNSRKVQWVHPFLMNFNGFRSVCLYFNLKVHFRWKHHILSMKGCHAIRPEYNCFISMIISVDTLCGFAPLPRSWELGHHTPRAHQVYEPIWSHQSRWQTQVPPEGRIFWRGHPKWWT